MAKVYASPINPPEINFLDKDWREKEEQFLSELKEWCQVHGSGPDKGEIIKIPMADGYAMYMVYKPASLIHIPLGDAWDHPLADQLSAKRIKEMVKSEREIAKIFS